MTLKLKRSKMFSGRMGPLLLIIMDGIGVGEKDETNAVYLANTPNLDSLFKSRFYLQLQAHGTAVGLPTDQDMGNSEVGIMHLEQAGYLIRGRFLSIGQLKLARSLRLNSGQELLIR